jgi:2-iminoacetate synthase ThiH
MKKERNWYVGLTCGYCGFRVTQKWDGVYTLRIDERGRPVEATAVHGRCKELGKP